jgi:hypothetical protein
MKIAAFAIFAAKDDNDFFFFGCLILTEYSWTTTRGFRFHFRLLIVENEPRLCEKPVCLGFNVLTLSITLNLTGQKIRPNLFFSSLEIMGK